MKTNKPNVQRYDNMGCPEEICRVDTMHKSDDGDYVLYEDYEAKCRELDTVKRVAYGNVELLEENKQLRNQLPPNEQGKNRYGLDMAYFRNLINRELNRPLVDFKPDELARVFARASLTADPDVMHEPEFIRTGGEVEPVGWYTEDHLDDKSATTYSAEVAQRWRDKGWPVTPLYTAYRKGEES